MSTDEFKLEMEALFMSFIFVEDATNQMDDLARAKELEGQRWGWLVDLKAADLYVMKPSLGVQYQGIHQTSDAATEAAISFIWGGRRDIVEECKRELSKGRAYRTSRAMGGSGMSIT